MLKINQFLPIFNDPINKAKLPSQVKVKRQHLSTPIEVEKINSVVSVIETETKFGIGSIVVPPKSLVIVTQGMWSSVSNVRPLARYIKKQGHQVYILDAPHVKWAQRMDKAKKWMSEKINSIRIIETQERLFHIQNQLSGLDDEKKLKWVRDYFALDHSDSGKSLTKHLVSLLSLESRFIDSIMALKPEQDKLSQMLEPYRKVLTENTSHKITNKIFDMIAPRAVVIAHSLGGVAGFQTLQATNDIGMVIGMGSPFNGASIPSDFQFLGPFLYPIFYGIYQLIPYKNSPIVKMQKTPLPIDTTVIALANPKDGLVSINNNSLNGTTGTLQIQVTPKEANMKSLIADSKHKGFFQWLGERRMSNYNELSERDWSLFKGLRHHCGFLEPKHFDSYYSEQGDIYHQIFESEHSTEYLKTLLNPQHYEPLQQQILLRLLHKITTNPTQVHNYLQLKAELKKLASHDLPFLTSSNKLAAILLEYLETS